QARERAILRAVAAYGTIVVDPRRLVDANGTFLCETGTCAERVLASVRSGSIDSFVRAVDLSHGRELLLPAPHVFPMLRPSRVLRIPCGTSAALDWRGALADGLLQHCVRLTAADPACSQRELGVEDYDRDPVVRFLAAMIRAAGI